MNHDQLLIDTVQSAAPNNFIRMLYYLYCIVNIVCNTWEILFVRNEIYSFRGIRSYSTLKLNIEVQSFEGKKRLVTYSEISKKF